jgi:putative flippase GtrA
VIFTNPKERKRFFKFAFVGVTGSVVDFGVFNLLASVFKVNAVTASVISFILGVINNFLWNRFWTYPDSRGKAVTSQMVQFGLINVIGLAIRTPLFAWLEKILIANLSPIIPSDGFLIPMLNPTFVSHNLALAIAILIVMFWNFFANRFWTYNDVSN